MWRTGSIPYSTAFDKANGVPAHVQVTYENCHTFADCSSSGWCACKYGYSGDGINCTRAPPLVGLFPALSVHTVMTHAVHRRRSMNRLLLSPVIASMTCPEVTTPTTSSGFATWPQTFVTQTATGTCMPNYGGYVTRYCAPGGLWEIPSSSCIRAYYYSTWRRVVCFAGAVDGIVIVAIHVLIWRRHSLRPSSLLFPSSPHIYDGCAARH